MFCLRHIRRKGIIMKPEFWHKKWADKDIGFHEPQANEMLRTHFDKLHLHKRSRVFLPLCGKTNDIAWITTQDHQVVGIELSKTAIEELFQELALTPEITTVGKLTLYKKNDIEIYNGDFFDLTKDILGQVDAIYDRAALMALSYDLRIRYAAHLQSITSNAPQLLNCFTYNQDLVEGPPFSIDLEELKHHYSKNYKITHLDSKMLPHGVKGQCPGDENIWLLE